MIQRIQETLIRKRLEQFPAVCIVGPRQAGKTTLAKTFSTIYFDLEQEADRVRLDLLWTALIAEDRLVILDEAQSWPEIFPRLRGVIDARRKSNGRFLLLGSVSPSLMKQVSESLAGRMALVDLPPLSSAELPPEYADSLWKNGGFPDGGCLHPELAAFPVWQASYLRQMSHQDLPAWGLPSKPQQTDRLMRMIAAIHGSQFNASQLGQGLGITYHTVSSYLDFLEGAFLIRRLPPFFAGNFPKRLIKTPKIYWRDSGLLHSLLGLASTSDLIDQPWVGESWEGWVIDQIINTRQATGESLAAYYFRTSDGLECDLLLDTDQGREVIEIKLSSSPSSQTFSKLSKIAQLVGATKQVVISRIPDESCIFTSDRSSLNLHTYLSQFTGSQASGIPEGADRLPTQSELFSLLRLEAGGLIQKGVLGEKELMQRASLLAQDLKVMAPVGFRLLPPRWLLPQESEINFTLVEYAFDQSGHDIDNADDPLVPKKEVSMMNGTGLDRESLLYLSKVSETGHKIIPSLWPADEELCSHLKLGPQHLDTLNEVWWLSRWQGIDEGSVEHEKVVLEKSRSSKRQKAPSVDWSFTILGGQVRINLEVKNRRGTKGSEPFSKEVYLFANHPEKPFRPSKEHEINVLAITAYHGAYLSEKEEASLVATYLDSLEEPVIDAVVLMVKGGTTSYEKIHFPQNRALNKKDLILKAVFKPSSLEDHSGVGMNHFPRSLQDVLKDMKKAKLMS